MRLTDRQLCRHASGDSNCMNCRAWGRSASRHCLLAWALIHGYGREFARDVCELVTGDRPNDVAAAFEADTTALEDWVTAYNACVEQQEGARFVRSEVQR